MLTREQILKLTVGNKFHERAGLDTHPFCLKYTVTRAPETYLVLGGKIRLGTDRGDLILANRNTRMHLEGDCEWT